MPVPTFAPDHPVAPFGTALINETVPAGGGLSVDNTVLFLGKPSTKVNIPVNLGSPTFAVGTSSASFDLGAEAEQVLARTKVFAVRTDGQNTITSAFLQVGNAGLTVGYQFTRRNFYTDTHDGWTLFVREPGHDGVAGSPDLTGNVRTRLTLTASANIVAGDVWIGFAGVLEAQPPTVVLTFDDGYAEWTWLASELASRGLPASFGISYGDVGKPGYLSSSEVQAIGNHVSGLFEITNHAEGNDSLTDLGLSAYIGEVEACRTYIEGLGLDPYAARLHAWVQGVLSTAAIDELKDLGYHSARAVETPGMVANHVSIALDGDQSNALYAIPATAYLNSSHTVADVQAQIEFAAPGGTVFVVGHEFKASAGPNGWINGYDEDHGILDLLDWLEDKRDNDGWTIQNWSTWHKEITGAAVEGSLVATLGAASLVATGAAPASGSLNASLAELTLVSTGEAQSAPVVGELDATLGALTATATASAPAAGVVSDTLGAVALSAAGESEIAGAVDSTLGSLSVAATGESTVTGSMSAPLGGLMLVASGGVLVAGALDATLGALTADAQASAPAAGVVGATLGELSAQASGVSTVAAQLDATLGSLSLYSINGTPETVGVVDATLGALTSTATGRVQAQGSLGATLGGLTLSATAEAASPAAQAILDCVLAPLAVTAAGVVPVAAVLDASLGSLTLVARNTPAQTGPYSASVSVSTRGADIRRIA